MNCMSVYDAICATVGAASDSNSTTGVRASSAVGVGLRSEPVVSAMPPSLGAGNPVLPTDESESPSRHGGRAAENPPRRKTGGF